MAGWVRYFEPGGWLQMGDKLRKCPGQERALDDNVSEVQDGAN